MQSLDGFEIVRELGRGGMGVVYEARHPTLDRAVALKVILESGATPDGLARFAREAQLLARLQHPNVVQIHKLGTSPQGPYLVTELLEGQGLDALAATGLEPTRAATIVRDLATGVDALHTKGVVHRDLKPDNVFVRPDGSPVLLDFGIARDVGAEKLTQTGVVVGTPAYMPPEQANDGSTDDLDERSDVYGLGAVLFSVLARRAPFDGANHMVILKKVLTNEPRWPSADFPATPRDLEAMDCQRAMSKEPEDRYPSARALAADLTRFLNGEPVTARPRRRVPLAALAVAGLLLLTVAGAVVATASSSDTAAETSTTAPETQAERRKRERLERLARRAALELERAIAIKDFPTRHHELGAWLAKHPTHTEVPRAKEQAALAQLEFPIAALEHPGKVFATFAGAKRAVTTNLGTGGQLINVWSVTPATATLQWSATGQGEVLAFAADLDGTRLVVGKRDGVFVLDLTKKSTLQPTTTFRERVLSLTLAPNGGLLAVRGERGVSLFSWPDGASQRTLTPESDKGALRGDFELAVSSDNALLVAGGGASDDYHQTADPGTARMVIWKLSTDETPVDFEARAKPTAITFVPNTSTLLVGDVAGNVYTLDASTPKERDDGSEAWEGAPDERYLNPGDRRRPTSHNGGVVSGVACSRDGKTAYSVSKVSNKDGKFGQFRVWDVETGKELRFLKNDGKSEHFSCDLSPDGTQVLVGTSKGRALIFAAEGR